MILVLLVEVLQRRCTLLAGELHFRELVRIVVNQVASRSAGLLRSIRSEYRFSNE